MNKKVKKTTTSDLEKVTKILADFIAQASCADNDSNAKKNPHVPEIIKNTSQANILQNLYRQTAKFNDMNTQNNNTVAPFSFYININQFNTLFPQTIHSRRNLKKNRL